jgi:uncharacterized membrane protein
MADIESLLNRWQSAGVLDAETAGRIRAYETDQAGPAGQSSKRLGWQGLVALILGAMLLACGVVLFVSAHWDQLGPGARYTIVMAMVAFFHIGAALSRDSFRGLSTALHAVGTVSTGAAIALVGQIFNIQEHWPAAILLWAAAALAGWILLRDEAQETLTLLLFPAWLLAELSYYSEGHIGQDIYIGRFLLVWAVLYLTVFLGSKHKIAQGILFASASISALVGITSMLASWQSWSGSQTFLPLHTRIWGWAIIAALPLFFALFRFSKSVVPVTMALVVSLALPWCSRTWTEYYNYGTNRGSYNRTEPVLSAHALVAAFCIFIIWWGVRQASKALVNVGIVGFAITVVWFYFSDIFDKIGRSLGLIGIGILFLAGGWALEKMRRKLVSQMSRPNVLTEDAQ